MFDIWCPLFDTFFLYPSDANNGNIDWLLAWFGRAVTVAGRAGGA